jgi:hypothetical protein
MFVLETAGKEMLIIVKERSIRDERQIVSLSGRACWEGLNQRLFYEPKSPLLLVQKPFLCYL